MSKKGGNGDVLRCSFCNKSQRDVKKLIAGPTVYICDECVDICLDIIAEDRKDEPGTLEGAGALPKPKEIKEFLDQYVIGQERAKKKLAVAVEESGRHGGQRSAAGRTEASAPGVHSDRYDEHSLHLRRGVRRSGERDREASLADFDGFRREDLLQAG